MSDKPLKAYVVREAHEGHCSIQFSTHGVTARRQGALELNVDFEDVESCTRAPQFDQYAPGPVPLHATLEAGWWHTCCGCECNFDVDGRSGDVDDWREDEFEPVSDGRDHHYCSHACLMEEWQERRERHRQEAAAIEACQTAYPEATRIQPYRSNRRGAPASRATEWRCSFEVPGLANHVDWTVGDTHVYVWPEDVDAWKRLYSRGAT